MLFTPAQRTADRVGHENQRDEDQQHRQHFTARQHFHRQLHLLAEAAGADKAHHDRRADRAFPAIDGIRHELRQAYRQRPVEECLGA
jgi:hypothetical protein